MRSILTYPWVFTAALVAPPLAAAGGPPYMLTINGAGEETSLQVDLAEFPCEVTLLNVHMLAIGEWHSYPPWKEGWHGVWTAGSSFLTIGECGGGDCATWLDHPSGFWWEDPCVPCGFSMPSWQPIESISFDRISLVGLIDPGVKFSVRVMGEVQPRDPDLNGDGAVDGSDLLLLFDAWGTPCGDLTGSGTTDSEDLLVLLQAWDPAEGRVQP